MIVSTLGSHSALQILHGAKKEGFPTTIITENSRENFYRRFSFIDNFRVYKNLDDAVNLINSVDGVLIPHGSLVEYLGIQRTMNISIPIFGNRNLFSWESNQQKKMYLLKQSGIRIPESFESPEDIDRLVIIKLPGAKGGKGYFLAKDKSKAKEGINHLIEEKYIKSSDDVIIQEYVTGIPMYFQFFYSPIFSRNELTGMDIRYETNVDGLKRVPGIINTEPSFVVAGNIPVVARESLLPKIFDYADRFVETTRQLVKPGIVGPYSLETIVTDELDIVVFEFSGRIVAGTNLYVDGSPYSWLYWDEPMSVGRRISREIKIAVQKNKLGDVTT
ncbi:MULTISPECIES: formate--phosphoribosylaminoimidazolecarboxamide ligase [Acidianus]|uniref:5-formaminoimidazole-4-carboxamide-1-(beta)-D-ribofuranosyl 5'-monophosphate synthetase n=1 Tax=Candidatus Acidianus copahuensis TaxID=1160895 RepID=A0A031LLQ5_9CREN|nr:MULTISPECIES: formate--phosphoribosylaminoimidazolecarboxamide ligase [Acidianus]EZQ03071.1 5-formaminoimidazole-4-carboxamide-1-(beta)-D-ribofuranosyl 5'-monophosphate synthetase [Candidatus Acidianus copahuensis]NON62920.1 formate--phosphoribosylaminoimidazolecarboxamide ligase [Acidianus sp. RZ1]